MSGPVHMLYRLLSLNESIKYQFGEDQTEHNLFVSLIEDVLKSRAGAEVGELRYVCSFLRTEEECMQPPHMDYDHKFFVEKDGTTKKEVPWCADIPLRQGGMSLNVWYGFRKDLNARNDASNRALKIDIPEKWMILWRGDLVHGVGYDNKLKNGALRMHFYLSLHVSTRRIVESREGELVNSLPGVKGFPYSVRFLMFLSGPNGEDFSDKKKMNKKRKSED